MNISFKLRFLLIFSIIFPIFVINDTFVPDSFLGVSTVIGPDTYGLLNQYTKLYEEGLLEIVSNEVKVDKYINFLYKLEDAYSNVFSKYKEVSAIFMSTSRFYYNYRHSGNVFAVLSQYIKFGPMSNKNMSPIMPETCACHPTNTAAGRIYIDSNVNLTHYKGKISEDKSNKYNEDVIMKYNGHGILKKHFRYTMTSRYPKQFPNTLKVFTQYSVDEDPLHTKFIYMTGHGGDSYLQFQAKDFISSLELSKNFKEMNIKEPNMKIFALLDTCQASTMYNYLDKTIPMAWVASSTRGESSYSHNPNPFISISTCDKFTFVLATFLNNVLSGIIYGTDRASVSRLSLKQFLRNYERNTKKERIEYYVSKNIYDKDEANKKLEKIYLGQFIFNYRRLYLNSLKFKVSKKTSDKSEFFLNFKNKNVESLKNGDNKLFTKMLEEPYLETEEIVTVQMEANGILVKSQEKSKYLPFLLGLAVLVALVQEYSLSNKF